MLAPVRLSARLFPIALAAFLAVGAVVLTGIPALAHAELTSSTPADGANLDTPPTAVELTFSDPLDPKFVQVAVLAADETHVEQGEPQIDQQRVTQPVGNLTSGDYSISYRVVSADGHPVSGVVEFTVTSAATQESPVAQVPTDPEPTDQSTPGISGTNDSVVSPDQTNLASPKSDSEGPPAPLIFGLLAAVVVVGGIIYLVMGRRPGTSSPGDGQA